MQHIVLIPGLLCSADLFAPQVEALGSEATIAIAATTGMASIEEMADALLTAAPERFGLAGLSMGGYVAFEVYRRAPERVARLALIDTNARADLPEQAARRREFVAIARSQGLRKVQGLLLPFLLGPSALQEPIVMERVLAMAEAFTPDLFAAQQEAIIARPDNRPLLSRIACPTLIIVGRDDRLTPVKVAEEMASGIAGSRLEIIEACGHLATLEKPIEVNRLLRDWFVGGT